MSYDILIDDFVENVQEWEAQGGTGILFRDAESARKRLEELKKI